MKKWHLYLFITVIFLGSFYYINTKYDRFYRVQGINNDNRILIETYLDEEQQDYLIENRIPVSEFIDYIKVDGFDIQNCDYYNLLRDAHSYKKMSTIVKNGNKLKEKATADFNGDAFEVATELTELKLESGYINKAEFNYDYIEFYTLLKPLFKKNKYVGKTEEYLKTLTDQGITEQKAQLDFINKAVAKYDKSGFKQLMKMGSSTMRLIADPTEPTVVVNDQSYISNYEPENLTLLSVVKRYKYAMYCTDETYDALVKMLKAMGRDMAEKVIVAEAYISYNETKITHKKKAGHLETQLGTTLDFTQLNYSYYQFEDTKLNSWLQKNAYKYGFVLRYPKNKASYTGKTYDPHIYRYVGEEAAKQIHNSSLSIEEYNLIERNEDEQ
ncbi:MAG: M15 family metallopeptidase [Erysipelotrichaceae bacterium]|nr:M15 family metallopeptidase [Erysipelotrichaceae bacterium]